MQQNCDHLLEKRGCEVRRTGFARKHGALEHSFSRTVFMTITRRQILNLAGVASASAALSGALAAEGLAAAPAAPTTTDENGLPFALTTPMHVGKACLRVRDLDLIAGYYRDVLKLEEISSNDQERVLGAGGVALLHLVHRPDAPIEDRRSAGLFHIAYLMPSRQDLARWLVHAAMLRVPLTGFADHSVSEAVYLNDPEGNGIEVYADRPRDRWSWDGDLVTMGTEPLDVDDILLLADTTKDTYTAVPEKLRIGHIHLKVGDVAKGIAFYGTGAGMEPTRGNRPDAAFLSSGRYHHHVAINSWNSSGAGSRDPASTGLDWFSIRVKDKAMLEERVASFRKTGFEARRTTDGAVLIDPWGTTLRLTLS
jgi:catechol 2,3-dioxygenase